MSHLPFLPCLFHGSPARHRSVSYSLTPSLIRLCVNLMCQSTSQSFLFYFDSLVFCVSSFVSPVTSFSFVSAVFLLPSLPFRVFKSSVSLCSLSGRLFVYPCLLTSVFMVCSFPTLPALRSLFSFSPVQVFCWLISVLFCHCFSCLFWLSINALLCCQTRFLPRASVAHL